MIQKLVPTQVVRWSRTAWDAARRCAKKYSFDKTPCRAPFMPVARLSNLEFIWAGGVAFWRANGLKLANPSSFLKPSGLGSIGQLLEESSVGVPEGWGSLDSAQPITR